MLAGIANFRGHCSPQIQSRCWLIFQTILLLSVREQSTVVTGRQFQFLVVFLTLLAAGRNNLTAQALGDAPSNHALANDVVRPYGNYEYVPQKKVYGDLNIGDVVEDFGRAFSSAGATVRKLNDYAGWSSRNIAGDFSFASRLGIQGMALPGVGLGWGTTHPGHNNGLSILLGPILLDNIVAGYGAMYNDINGDYAPLNEFPPDDRWAQILWLNFRATMALGDSISISLQPMIYWLPSTGKVGWGLPGPFIGLFQPQFQPLSLFEVAWTKELGNWKLALYDSFSPFLNQWHVLDVQLGSQLIGDLSPVDRVGRYQAGYAADLTNYDPLQRVGINNAGWDGLGGFFNMAGFRAYGNHGYHTQSMFYFDRIDFWDKDFRDKLAAASIRGGAYLQTGDQFLTTYTGYNFIGNEPFNTFLNWAVAGVRKQISASLRVYTEGGYFWHSGAGSGDKGWLGLVGFQQRLSPRTLHGGEAGRRVFTPIRSVPGEENYMEYRITHDLGLRSTISGFVGVSHRNFQSPIENDYIVKYSGVVLNTRITQRLTALASAGWEEVEFEPNNMIWDRWTERLGLMYTLTENIQSQVFYQHEDVHGKPFNYTEHYLYIGIAKRF